MKLSDKKTGDSCIITGTELPPSLQHRLEALGMTLQTPVTVLNRKGDGVMIVKLRGSRYALGGNITRNISVTDQNSREQN